MTCLKGLVFRIAITITYLVVLMFLNFVQLVLQFRFKWQCRVGVSVTSSEQLTCSLNLNYSCSLGTGQNVLKATYFVAVEKTGSVCVN